MQIFKSNLQRMEKIIIKKLINATLLQLEVSLLIISYKTFYITRFLLFTFYFIYGKGTCSFCEESKSFFGKSSFQRRPW